MSSETARPRRSLEAGGRGARLLSELGQVRGASRPRKRSVRRTPSLTQAQLETFRSCYNQRRPHRALGRRTPLVAFNARLKAKPAASPAQITHFRVREDKVDGCGRVTLRYRSRLHHIYIGRAHKGERIRLLIADAHVRIVREDGQLLRELTLDPSRDYQPRRAATVHNVLRQVSSMS